MIAPSRTRRTLRPALVLVAIALGAGMVQASAPTGQYAIFGRTDTCISDLKTRLTWLRAPLPATMGFKDAQGSCAAMGTGWRVPTVNELLTLVDEQPHPELVGGNLVLKAIDADAFPETPVGPGYWTSSENGIDAWAVNFGDGSTYSPGRGAPNEVRCVILTTLAPATMVCK